MANDMVLNGCLVALVFGQLLCNPPFLSDALFLRCFFLCENTVSKMLTTTLTSSGAHCPNDRLYWDRVTAVTSHVALQLSMSYLLALCFLLGYHAPTVLNMICTAPPSLCARAPAPAIARWKTRTPLPSRGRRWRAITGRWNRCSG
jgi:hypothetical protein